MIGWLNSSDIRTSTIPFSQLKQCKAGFQVQSTVPALRPRSLSIQWPQRSTSFMIHGDEIFYDTPEVLVPQCIPKPPDMPRGQEIPSANDLLRGQEGAAQSMSVPEEDGQKTTRSGGARSTSIPIQLAQALDMQLLIAKEAKDEFSSLDPPATAELHP
ncbi:hypothetical protein WISP_85118 [Willisornis vidua]|uniref:Uncharacterized protein n=1 Tax=Willisornis vidua TaxID=1566151 RepID=A0ABQ9D376_9PASS|nr:hypothetical protein WISP_85118 [Willisornis vidua]